MELRKQIQTLVLHSTAKWANVSASEEIKESDYNLLHSFMLQMFHSFASEWNICSMNAYNVNVSVVYALKQKLSEKGVGLCEEMGLQLISELFTTDGGWAQVCRQWVTDDGGCNMEVSLAQMGPGPRNPHVTVLSRTEVCPSRNVSGRQHRRLWSRLGRWRGHSQKLMSVSYAAKCMVMHETAGCYGLKVQIAVHINEIWNSLTYCRWNTLSIHPYVQGIFFWNNHNILSYFWNYHKFNVSLYDIHAITVQGCDKHLLLYYIIAEYLCSSECLCFSIKLFGA